MQYKTTYSCTLPKMIVLSVLNVHSLESLFVIYQVSLDKRPISHFRYRPVKKVVLVEQIKRFLPINNLPSTEKSPLRTAFFKISYFKWLFPAKPPLILLLISLIYSFSSFRALPFYTPPPSPHSEWLQATLTHSELFPATLTHSEPLRSMDLCIYVSMCLCINAVKIYETNKTTS